jgi:hypothetical protein
VPRPVCSVSQMAFLSANACISTSPVSMSWAMATHRPWASYLSESRNEVIPSMADSGRTSTCECALVIVTAKVLWRVRESNREREGDGNGNGNGSRTNDELVGIWAGPCTRAAAEAAETLATAIVGDIVS